MQLDFYGERKSLFIIKLDYNIYHLNYIKFLPMQNGLKKEYLSRVHKGIIHGLIHVLCAFSGSFGWIQELVLTNNWQESPREKSVCLNKFHILEYGV